jgi:hypothetical protein
VIGTTFSDNMAAAPLRPYAGSADAFVARIEADGSALGYFTYLGGADQDEGSAIAVDANGHAYVTGATKSGDFPAEAPLQAGKGGEQDAFVAKISPPVTGPSPAPARIVFSSFLGGSQDDYGYSVAVNGAGNVYVAGSTRSQDFPAKQRIRAYNDGLDGFISKISPAGDSLVFSTLLGGSADDLVFALCLDSAGSMHLLGTTNSPDFPVANFVQGSLSGFLADIFVTQIQEGNPQINPILNLLLD